MTTTAAIGRSPRRDPSNHAYYDVSQQNKKVYQRSLVMPDTGSSLLPMLLYNIADANS